MILVLILKMAVEPKHVGF